MPAFDSTKPVPEQQADLLVLLRGLARWRVALSEDDSVLSDGALHRDNVSAWYVFLDTDVVRMYVNPSAAAGYLGLRYYGRANKADPSELATAAALAGSFARFLLFDFQCRQKSSEPRLLLPGHAEEIHRGYSASWLRANSAVNAALDEVKALRLLVASLELAVSSSSVEDIHAHLTAFIEKWFALPAGRSEVSEKPERTQKTGALQAMEEADRYRELFLTARDGSHSERLLNASVYEFGEPFSGFPPLLTTDARFEKRFRSICKDFKVDEKHQHQIRSEIESGTDNKPVGLAIRTLKHATDAYALAWLQTLEEDANERKTQSPFHCRLISGAELLNDQDPKHVVSPLRLLSLYLQSKLSDSAAHKTLEDLKTGIDGVLSPLHADFSNRNNSDIKFPAWCLGVANLSIELGSKVKLELNQLDGVLHAWNVMVNLLVARDAALVSENSSFNSGQTLLSLVKSYAENPENISPDHWLASIETALLRASTYFATEASELILEVARYVEAKVPRNPPPLRLDDYPIAKQFAKTDIWRFASSDDTPKGPATLSDAFEKLKKEPGNEYVILVLAGLALCAMGRWRSARPLFSLALDSIKVENPAPDKIKGTEAAYGLAVTWHVTARNSNDLDQAQEFLKLAEVKCREKHPDRRDVRFETEELSIGLMRCWANANDSKYVGNVRKDAKEWLLQCFALSDDWSNAEGTELDQYVIDYTHDELMSCTVQYFLLAKYTYYQQTLFESSQSALNDADDTRLREHCLKFVRSIDVRDKEENSARPAVTKLARLNYFIAKHYANANLSTMEKSWFSETCLDRRNEVIPLVDPVRLTFFRLWMMRLG